MKLLRPACCAAFALLMAACGQTDELSMLRMKRSFEDMLGVTYDLRRDIRRDVDAARTMPLSGPPFNRYLHTEYLRLAETQLAQGDTADARRYVQRAVAAAHGERVYPEEASTRHFEPAKARQMREVRDRLMALLYRHQGTTGLPDVAAHAQAMFDCWQEDEADEAGAAGSNDNACRTALFKDMIALAPAEEAPKVRELVVLLPSEDGTVGSVTVTGAADVVVLNQARQATEINEAATSTPVAPFAMAQEEVDATFAEALAAMPILPIHASLYFENDSLELTAASKAALPRILQEISRRPVPDVIISGHADRAGTSPHNDKLSEKRAKKVRDAIIKVGVAPELIGIRWFGENVPVVETPDGVGEPRNRRVEVVVR